MDTTTVSFVQVNTATLEVLEGITSALAHRLYCRLTRLRDYTTNSCKVSHARLAAALDVTTEGVRKALSILRDAGLIDWRSQHRKASTYTVNGLFKGLSVNQTQVGSNCPTQVGSISKRVSSQEPPLPPSEPETPEASPTDGWEDLITRTKTSGRVGHDASRNRAVGIVSPDGSFDETDRAVSKTMGTPLPDQDVYDPWQRVEYEGPSHAPLRPDATDAALDLLIGRMAVVKAIPRAFTRLKRSIAAMAVSGEISPHLLERAALRAGLESHKGLNLSQFAAETWIGVLVNRWDGRRVTESLEFRYGDHRPTPYGVGTTPAWLELLSERPDTVAA